MRTISQHTCVHSHDIGLNVQAIQQELNLRHSIHSDLVQKVKNAFPQLSVEATLCCIKYIAQMAAKHHSGIFADRALEAMCVEIGMTHVCKQPIEKRVLCKTSRRRVLHVATTVYYAGGHTRLIENWIVNDHSSVHDLYLTGQRKCHIPEWLIQAVTSSGGQITHNALPLSFIDASSGLRRHANGNYDVIVLHHHPDDVVPLLAFAMPGGPPVLMMNHSDHTFSLGTSIADVLVEFREVGMKHSRGRRFAQNHFLLPIPLSPKEDFESRESARRALGIRDDEVICLSVGSAWKFTPCGRTSFFDAARSVLEKNRSVKIVMIGPTSEHFRQWNNGEVSDRIDCIGEVERLTLHRWLSAADIYLESFPVVGGTAILDACHAGLPVVTGYGYPCDLFDSRDMSPAVGELERWSSKGEYVEFVSHLVEDEAERVKRGTRLACAVIKAHTGYHWNNRLTFLYKLMESVSHTVTTGLISSEKWDESDRFLVDIDLRRSNNTRIESLNKVANDAKCSNETSDNPERKMLLYALMNTSKASRACDAMSVCLHIFKSHGVFVGLKCVARSMLQFFNLSHR